jgi:hypothetical protein
MSDIISDLAEKSGLSADQAKKGFGAVLSFLKGSLPADTFNQVSAAVPGSEQMMDAAGPHEESSGGILGTIKEMAHKLFGGGGAAAGLLAKFTGLGLSAEQVQSFLPRVMELLRSKLPESAMTQVSKLLPTPQETPA